MAQVSFKRGSYNSLPSTKEADVLYFATDKGVLYLGSQRISDIVIASATPTVGNTIANQLYIYDNKLYFRGTQPAGDGTQDTVICLDAGNIATELAAIKNLIGTIPSTSDAEDVIEYVDEQVGDLKDELTQTIAAKVASVSATDKSINVDNTVTTAPKLKVNLHTASEGEATNALVLKENGLYVPTPAAADTYEIVKASNSGNFAAVYQLMKKANGTGAGTQVGVDINIPKDMVVQSGSVVTITDATKGKDGNPENAGTYIKLVLQNVTDPLFIDVSTLIEYVTGGTAEDGMITIAVDGTTHVATATLNDGKVTLAKLETAVQTKINQAHTHANSTELDKVQTGDVDKWNTAATKAGTAVQEIQINAQKVDATSGVVNITAVTGDANGQVKVAGQNVDVKGLQSAAYQTSEYFIGTSGDLKTANTINGAKAYADDAVQTALTWGSF